MPDVIFARTRTTYDSYQDYWRLVELSGFPTCYIDEIDTESDHTYIYTPSNGETREGWPGAKARIIHYQLEWENHPNDQHPTDPGVAEKWTHDKWHAERIGARYVPIGGHEKLRGWVDHSTGYWAQGSSEWNGHAHDVVMLAYMTNRRIYIRAEGERKGIDFAPNAWGEERNSILQHTRAMLHVHQHDDIPGVASLRFVVAAAYSLPVITETCADTGIFGHSDLLSADYKYLVDFALDWLKPECAPRLADYGHALHQKLCVEQTFRKVIEAAV